MNKISMEKFFALGVALVCASAQASPLIVESFDYYGPYAVQTPLMVDSLDVNSNHYAAKSLLKQPLQKRAASAAAKRVSGPLAPTSDAAAMHMLAFTIQAPGFSKPTLKVEGLKEYAVTVDGEDAGETLTLRPGSHRVAIKYLSEPGTADSLRVSLEGDPALSIREDGRRSYTLNDVQHGPRLGRTEVSPTGRYMITGYTNTAKGGAVTSLNRLYDTRTGRTLLTTTDRISWMPRSDRYYTYRQGVDGLRITVTDPADGSETVLAEGLPEGYPVIMPDEKRLLIIGTQEGPKEDPQVYQVLEPEDRQPGWRNRQTLAVYDTTTGTLRPLTHGHRAISMLDIAPDSKHVLLSVRQSRLEERPTTLNTIISLNIDDMTADTIVADDGFIGGACYAPGHGVIVSGWPEALGGIGKNLPADRVPSMIDTQLYFVDANRKVTPLTRTFDPNVTDFQWCEADGMLYLTAENRDCISLYRLNPANGKIQQIATGEDIVKSFSAPVQGRTGAFTAQSMDNPDRLYTIDLRTLRTTMLDEPQREMLADVDFGSVEGWSFVNSRGDSIHGRFYLPPNFDASKKYPMIVNYYGGCSPTSRNFESRYPHHAYAAQGYVVYVVEPSGATGFGQEFSSRHVSTAGQGVADDIIEGTRRFCEEHPYVDASKIGCIGASYGGFMTQYLQTVTDLFAAAISHAGISDHTSYWGEGYWGYSYSEVSMGADYPWSKPDLYVKQSPLFRADKIHTPLLFLHGDKDNNVPVGESIQMFTALKLLGRETAFVAVADQDHHILDYDKRRKWQDTIDAWFAKYLKGDPTWWDTLYPLKQL